MSPLSSAGLSGAPLVSVPRIGVTASGAPLSPITEPDGVAAAVATWCAPTPTHCQSWGGDAHLAAVPSFRYGERPYRLTVCLPARTRCTVVEVVSFCACGSADIDLSPAAFRDLADTSAGRIRVTISDARPGPATTPPPTDVGP